MRYSGSRLACASCHLGIGTEPGTLTLLQTTQHYPRFSGRVGAQTDIEDRINECMQRSMNGKPLPADSRRDDRDGGVHPIARRSLCGDGRRARRR